MIRLLCDIWNSFRGLPLWVQWWVFGILVPANFASVLFVGQPNGWLVSCLAIGGILPNAVLLVVERGFSRAMAISHIVVWTPLIVILADWVLDGSFPEGAFGGYLSVLAAINLVSLLFDLRDAWNWVRGQREVSGRE